MIHKEQQRCGDCAKLTRGTPDSQGRVPCADPRVKGSGLEILLRKPEFPPVLLDCFEEETVPTGLVKKIII